MENYKRVKNAAVKLVIRLS